MRIETKQRLDRTLGWWLLVLLRPLVRSMGLLLRRDHAPTARGEIVVIKMVGGGSLILALPSLVGIRRRYPDFALTLVCGRAVAPFGEIAGVFDRIEVIEDGRSVPALLGSAGRVLLSLNLRRVDTVIDFEVYSVLTTVFASLTRARNRIGFYLENTHWRRNVLTHLVFFNRASGVYHFYEAAARLLGAEPVAMETCREHLRRRLEAPTPEWDRFLVIGAGCSEFGSVRLLPPAEWAAFASSRREILEATWVFLGSAADREVSEAVALSVSAALPAGGFRYVNLCGKTSLSSAVSLIALAQGFVGIDSALLHFARMLGVPATSVWGPTAPTTRLQPIDGYQETVHYRPPICSPCIHVSESPPCQGNNVCMRLFTSDAVPAGLWCQDASGRAVGVLGAERDRGSA
jgi:ADP-heptose:LPS heptosyltransferase